MRPITSPSGPMTSKSSCPSAPARLSATCRSRRSVIASAPCPSPPRPHAGLPAPPGSLGERLHENGSLDSRFNLLCGGFGRLRRFVREQHERLTSIRGDVEPVSVTPVHGHHIADLPHCCCS